MSTLLITGTGSLAKRIMFRFREKYDKIIAYSRCEYKHSLLPNWVTSEIGDIRDGNRLRDVFRIHKPDVVITTAAMKRVNTLEEFPYEATLTNVGGTENVARCSDEFGVTTSVLISTDKCVKPAQVYGATKLIARAIYANYAKRSNTRFLTVLYGNVCKSRGSFIPIWEEKIRAGEPVYITHEDCTRFMFSLDDSVDLIDNAIRYGYSGETLIPIMDAFRVTDVAKALSIIEDKPLKMEIANKLRPGEKLHEEMLTELELSKTYTTPVNKVVAVTPYWYGERYPRADRKLYTGPVIKSDLFLNDNIQDLINLIKRSTVDV